VEGEDQTRRFRPLNIGLKVTASDCRPLGLLIATKEKLMKPGTKDEVAGKIHEVKGAVKEKVGKLTNNPDLEAEGRVEKVVGEVQNKMGQVKKVLGT
jgi:uncharacterized protein YjbJ (UPF0337 family)